MVYVLTLPNGTWSHTVKGYEHSFHVFVKSQLNFCLVSNYQHWTLKAEEIHNLFTII